MTQIEQLINLFRKKFAIPNLIICIGILFFLGKMSSIWFSPAKEPGIKLAKINLGGKSGFFSKRRNVLLSDYEVIPKKNLFRSSRAEWVPPAPPAPKPPPPPPPPPAKLTPPPEITVSGILEGSIFTKRAILEGKYFTPKASEKKEIKKKGYKLYDMIGQYKINNINNDKVVLIDPKGKSYEFYMNKNGIKRKEILSKPNKLKGENLLGAAVKKWEPPEEPFPHVSGAVIINPRQHISGN
tara:strand:- start:11591 stop:12310 length:720 start_codon:yes stop_codon:yes gene_type:complete